MLELIRRAYTHGDRLAVVDESGAHTYAELLDASHRVAACLLAGTDDLREARVVFMVPSGFLYPSVQWGIWRAGGIAVPLGLSHPLPEIEYVLDDTGAALLVAHPVFAEKLRPVAGARAIRLITTDEATAATPNRLPDIDMARRAMILYTSGTTSKPKGVVATHAGIAAMITTLVEAWAWSGADHILHVLPLHHTHGIVNVLLCALWAGAVCEMLPAFDGQAVWHRFVERPLTLFMAVPTIYGRLLQAWEAGTDEERTRWSAACRKMRLMVSGSAALPVRMLEAWKAISGHTLLERYGMTEIGMALSNPLHGERRPGFVGTPLPGMAVRLVDEAGALITDEGRAGEIQVRGPSLFLEYWNNPKATQEAFRDGWFLTGDVAMREDGYYRILGRNAVDIIKTGGFKVSALEIEEVLRTHPAVQDCAVVGVDDAEWGERVCVAVQCRQDREITLASLRSWAKARLAPYKIPTRLLVVDELPRNAMGKVTKPAVKAMF